MIQASDSSESLIQQAQAGDREAFDRLAEGLRERLEGLVTTRLGSVLRQKVEVEDVVQEALLRGFRSIQSFQRSDEDSLFRWLGGIANHVILEIARRHHRELIMALDDEIPADEPSASTAERRKDRFERLQAAFNTLSPDHRTVILLARIDRLSMAEVARHMDRSPEAASQLLWRALKKLKEAFGRTDSFHLPDRRLEDQGGTHARP